MITEDSDIDDDLATIMEYVQRHNSKFNEFLSGGSTDTGTIARALSEIANQFAYANMLKGLETMLLLDDDEDGDDGDDEDDEEDAG